MAILNRATEPIEKKGGENMIYKGHIITDDTLSIIGMNNDGSFYLVIFHEKNIVFENNYKTRTAAERVCTMKLNRYDLLEKKFSNKD